MANHFCSGKFWDLNQSWNNQVPDFSECFQDVVFVSTPSILFSFIFLIDIWRLRKVPGLNPLQWTWLNKSKMVLSLSLLLMSCVRCVEAIYTSIAQHNSHSTILSSCLKVILFIVLIFLMLRHRTCGVATSYALSVFWIVFTICGILLHRSAILTYFTLEVKPRAGAIFILNMIYYPFIYIHLFLSLFTDAKKLESLQDSKIIENVSFVSFITFSWFNRFIYLSRKKMLAVCDLEFINVCLVAKRVYEDFAKRWQIYSSVEIFKNRSLALSLMTSFWEWLVLATLFEGLYMVCLLVPPLLLDRLISFVEDDFFAWRGMLYVLLFFVVDFFGKIVNNLGVYYFFCSGCQMKSALMNAVYRKNLILSTGARKDFPSGAISNLLSVDIQRLAYFSWHSSTLITAPLRIITILVIMWQYIGVASLAGVGVMAVLLPISFYLSRVSQRFTEKQMQIKDVRLKFMNELLSGIKILKLYAWELMFSSKVTDARRKELKMVFYSNICLVITYFVFFCAPVMVSIASFATYLLIDRNNVLSPTKAFVTLTLMDQLKFAMFALPESISEFIQCNISLGRLKKFFVSESIDNSLVGDRPSKGEVLSVKQASFSWEPEAECTLTDINLHVPNGKLVAIIGPVGAGKSSLLSAVLGEIYKIKGCIDIKGTVAYVPQQAWILNQTVMQNILLTKLFKKEQYDKVLDLCCLRPDLEILPAGDMTEIGGEKGVNLSGGQKQRINLARAVYQDKDIYLLDDTLSAVDVHVRKALFDDIIGNEGLLRKKTRILVTHDVSMLHKVDLIVSMKEGRIEEIGTYQDLIGKEGGSFTTFIQEHTTQKQLGENAEENKKILSRFVSTDSNTSKISNDSGEHVTFRQSKEMIEKDSTYRLIEDEKMEIGKVNRLIYFSYIKRMGCLWFSLCFLGFAIYVIFETFGNIWLSEWASDPVVNGTQNISTTMWRLKVYGAQGFAQGVFIIIGSTSLMYGTVVAANRYHNKMLDSLIKSPMSFFDSTPMGRITNRFSSDLDVLDTELNGLIDGCIDCFLYTLSSFYIIGRSAPIFLATLVPIGVIYYILQKLHLHCFRQLRRLESTTKSPLYSQLLESIQGVSSICAYKVQREFIEAFEIKLDNHMVCYLSTIACNRWFNFLLDVVGSIIVFISITLAVQNRHSLNSAEIGLMIAYTLNVTDAIKWLVRMSTELEDKSISVERVDEYCHLESEAPWRSPLDDQHKDWPTTGAIEFDNYSTKYRQHLDLVLKEVNISIGGSEKVGIIGRTGAGKSSITMALFRIIEPTSGTIIIDKVDIREIGLHHLRSRLTIIPQDPVLFAGSLRSNLDPNQEYSDEALWMSLERSHLKSYVSSLEEGLEYNVEESGGNLSAGQKQLICLARALLKDTKILVLDEATASVDMETDNLIQNTIRTAFASSTVITIAHRLNTVLDYDKIIVMENGTILEVGSPESLLKNQVSMFHQMSKDAGLI